MDKNPGIRPIGIEETLRRILAKCLTEVVGEDLVEVFGVDQLAGTLEGGIEGAIHVMNSLFESKEGHGLLLLDAKNAFISINLSTAKLLFLMLARSGPAPPHFFTTVIKVRQN